MRKIILFDHVSLDGFVGGSNGEIDWVRVSDEMFDLVGNMTNQSDAAIYGRITWKMMDDYWVTAADKPGASRHDIQHSMWYNKVNKMVLSESLQGTVADRTTFIGDDYANTITAFKKKPGKLILMFGSATAAHSLMKHDLIDELWLLVNPVLLGDGIPLFANSAKKKELEFLTSQVFANGVVAVNYKFLKK